MRAVGVALREPVVDGARFVVAAQLFADHRTQRGDGGVVDFGFERREQTVRLLGPLLLVEDRCEVAADVGGGETAGDGLRSEEHTSELQSLMRSSYAVFCLKKKTYRTYNFTIINRECQSTTHIPSE